LQIKVTISEAFWSDPKALDEETVDGITTLIWQQGGYLLIATGMADKWVK
jgi:hypothetical protein